MHDLRRLEQLFNGSADTTGFCSDPDAVRYLLVGAYECQQQILNDEAWLQKMAALWKVSHEDFCAAYRATCQYMLPFMSDQIPNPSATISVLTPKETASYWQMFKNIMADSFEEKVSHPIVSVRNLQAGVLLTHLLVLTLQGVRFTLP